MNLSRSQFQRCTHVLMPNLYILDRETGSLVNLTQASGDNMGPVWAPIEDWIAFYSNRNGNYDIFVMNTEGEFIQITSDPGDDSSPGWRYIK